MVLLFFTAPLAYLPEAVLSAIVFLIGIDLIDLNGMRGIFDQRRSEFWVALITTSAVVLLGVEQGILLAISLSLIDHTRRGYAPKNTVLVPSEDGEWRPHPWTTKAQAAPGLIIYHFSHSMYYANAAALEEEIMALANSADPPLRWLCIDASAMDDVDYSAAETVRSLHRMLMDNGIRLVIAQVMKDIPAQNSYHLRELFGSDAFYNSLGEMIKDYQQQTRIKKTGEH
jgi:MFS superfamily sulfate permease-like transporter